MKKRSTNLMSRLTTLLLALLLLGTMAVAVCAEEAEPACYGYGDVNGDNGVDGRDAIYTLYHVMFSESYPVNQDCDFNEDGSVDSKDAIRILYGSLDMVPGCTLGGTVHQYYAPEWTWTNEEAVSVRFRCGCGSVAEFDRTNGIAVEQEGDSEPSCTEVTVLKFTAKVIFDDKEYTSEFTKTTPAAGHSMTGARNCQEGSSCTVCGFTLPALGHDWKEDPALSQAATCQMPGVQGYSCAREDCGATKTVELEGLAEHDFRYLQDTQLEEGCAFVKDYRCSNCDATLRSVPFYKHTYTATLTREATCSEEGEKTLTCSCGDSTTESVPMNGSHTWDEGVTDENGLTTLTCTGCGETTTVMKMEANQSVEKEAIGSAELQVEDTRVRLDEQTLEELGQTIALDVSILSTEDLPLEQGHAQQIGSNPIYDFSLYSNDSQVSDFAGEITVMLPYTLQEGDDVDCIDVWFISDTGEVEVVQGSYANGFVTFNTGHFSYYTVTRLTPEQRCEKYGHAWGTDHQDPTCTGNGHHVVVCRRCGLEEQNEVLERIPHDYQETRVEPTCTQDGSFEKICSVCRQKVSGQLPALGHAWNLNAEQSSDPGCTTAGRDVYLCGNAGCTESYTEEKAALGHDYEMIGQVNPDCTTSGYEGYKCVTCGHEYKSNEASPMGHDYAAENAVWQWAEDFGSATVKLVCSRNPEHTQTLTAVISKTVDAPNCNAGGEVTYSAVAAFNLKEYSDSKTVHMDKVGHQSDGKWQTNAGVHYSTCTFCGEMVDASAHVWGQMTVITDATCSRDGSGKAACSVCGYEKEITIPATRQHSFVDDVCSVCRFDKNSCRHTVNIVTEDLDLGAYDLCSGCRVWWETCACGERKILAYELGCDLREGEEIEGTLPNGETGLIYTRTCDACGLVMETANYKEMDPDSCSGTFVYLTRMSRNGEIILENWERAADTFRHSADILVETVDLTDKGLCGVRLEKYRCQCGEVVRFSQREDTCDWDYMGNENGVSRFLCTVCGATQEEVWDVVQDKENCKSTEINKVAYFKDGQEVFSYENIAEFVFHDYQLKEYWLEGSSCEDGVLIHQVCSVCQEENEFYTTWHETVKNTRTDLSNLGLCADSALESSCVCGQERHFSLQYSDGGNCVWETVEGSNQDNRVNRCVTCGLEETRQVIKGEKNEACVYERKTILTYKKADGTLVVEGSSLWTSQDHDFLVTRELSGTSCENGVKITEVCRDCGHTRSRTTTGHSVQKMEAYDLSEYGLCGGELSLYSCACGYESWVNWNDMDCQFHWVSGDDGTEVSRCEKCDVTRKITYSDSREVSSCRHEQDVSITLIKNNKNQLKVGFTETYWSHRDIHTFRLIGTTCLDGYYVTETCMDCGETDTWSVHNENAHGTWAVSREMLVEGKLCGDLELVTYQCACGTYKNQSVSWVGEKQCEYDSGEYVASEDAWMYTCIHCGGQSLEKRRRVPCDQTCAEQYESVNVYYQDGKELCRVETTDIQESHPWVCTYELLGKDCEDGYRYTRTCPDCGLTRGKSGIQYNCSSRRVAREVLLDRESVCGPVTLETYDSACGKDYHQELTDHCDMEYINYEQGKGDIYQCRSCGLRRVGRTKTVAEDGCDITRELSYTYSLEGEVLLELERNISDREHVSVASFELDGTTCEDGFRVTSTCIYCGRKSNGGTEYDHYQYRTQYIDLTQYGLCSGYVEQRSCACGQESEWDSYSYDCNWYRTGKTVNGLEEFYCAQCDTYRYAEDTGEHNRATCRWEGTFIRRYVRNGETLLELDETFGYTSHYSVVESFKLTNPARGCDGGYRVTLVCQDCGGNRHDSNGSGHNSYTMERVDLDGPCGGYISYQRCACGRFTYADVIAEYDHEDYWSEEGSDGYTHLFSKQSCSVCGLEWIMDEHTVADPDNCMETIRRTLTIRQNGNLIKEYDTQEIRDSHTFGARDYQLAPGSVTCEDGIIGTATCKQCGYQETYRYGSHQVCEAERIDLTPYGSVCGGDLVRYACPCGQHQRYDFAEDCQCDMDKKSISHFMPGTIDTAQHTTEGYVSTYSDSWMMTCAVTDPQCSLKIRMSEYWVDEDCMATEYQVWQLGYDETTGTCMQELLVPTGEKHAYHAYVYGTSTETLADGTVVETRTETCPNCSSSCIYRDYILNGTQIKCDRTVTNTKDNGENKRWYYVYERGLEHMGYRFATLERTEYTYADGSEYWYQYAYTYDFPAGCVRTTTYTNSSGEHSVSMDESHNTKWSRETVKESTCTQFGQKVERWTCVICGQVTSEYFYPIDPIVHSWGYEDTTGMYTCTVCGLENINGASGAIVLEDMTAAYGNGTDYVVGYWNRENVEARKYVSLILDEADGEEVVLTDIVFTELRAEKDGITAISFSQAEVQAAAETILTDRGYTGSYAIRFTFVPATGGDTLDYAITFDSQSV